MFKKINFRSDFLKYILVLMSGTVAAQVLSYAFAPIITRLYVPEESAELGIFALIISIGGALATARYELSFPIIKNESHSYRIYLVALRITLFVSIAASLLLIIPIITGQSGSRLIFYLLIPIALFSTALYNMGTNWAIRLKQFKSISYAKISNAILGNFSKIVFGWSGFGYIGLILGATIGLVFSNFWFFRDLSSVKKKYSIKSSSPRNFVLAREYREFPLVNMPHTLMDLGRDLLVAVILLQLFSKVDYGLYDHSYRMLKLPLILAGAAIGQVFFQHCSEKVNNNEDILPVLTKAVKTLILLSIVPFSVIFFFGEELFSFVFGENWAGAGTFSEIMAPWFLVNFITSPVSSLPLILRKQKDFFKLAVIGTFLMIASCSIPPLFFEASMISTLWILSGTQAAYLVFVIFRLFAYIKESRKNG